ncbi:hypothetical protein AC578_3072, partial [Pseudocercospora eumusae]
LQHLPTQPPKTPTVMAPRCDPCKCVVCYCPIENGGFMAVCGHTFCDECLTEYFKKALADENLFPPKCCGAPISFAGASDHLPQDIVKTLVTKQAEYTDSSRLYCHAPACSTYIPLTRRNPQWQAGFCPACEKLTCLICKGATHEGDCPEQEALKATERLASENGWRRCASCQRLIEKISGCNHITCVCKAEWCYVCGHLTVVGGNGIYIYAKADQ